MADRPAIRADYGIRLAKEASTFSAAHFITYDGDTCEPLHGHNYRVTVEAWGPLDENHYVFDFIAARDAVARITAELDHRVLLPTEHPLIRVEASAADGEAQEVTARFRERRWVFPASDCRLLPLANTTAELLARWIGGRLLDELGGLAEPLTQLAVEVDECDGQVGLCRLTEL